MQTTSNNSRGSAHLRGAVRFWSIPAAMLIAGCVGILSVPAAAQDVAAPTKAKPVRTKSVSKTTDKSAEGDVDGQAAATPKKRDPADAQRTLDSGIKLLQAGKAEQAIQSFTVVIAGGNLPAPIMAKALHQRGAAYRVTAKPALALSDLTSALNELVAELNKDVDPQTGELSRDTGTRVLRRALSSLVGSTIMPGASPGQPATLADLGLAINRDGTFRLDTARLAASAKAAPAGVSARLTNGIFGVFATLDKLGRVAGSPSDPGSIQPRSTAPNAGQRRGMSVGRAPKVSPKS